jgi:mycothiol synthase
MTAGTQTELHLPDAPTIDGLRFRSVDLDADLVGLVALISDVNLGDDVDWLPTVEQLRNDLTHRSNFDIARDVLVAEIGGRIVGMTMVDVAVRDGVAVHQMDGWVHPDERRRGIGRALLHWTESRSRDVAASWPGQEPHAHGTWVDEHVPGGIALLEGEGYERVRYGFMMVRSLTDPIPDAPMPDGLEVRAVAAADHRRIWDADVEAFQDHWGAHQRTEEDYEGWFSTPGIDTGLWRVAWAGDEVAGSVWNFVWTEENERLGLKRGWLEHISVRRPWRRRGLATALIADSLRTLRDRGLTEAALGVDAENLSGALRLYESIGFRRHRTGISYRKAF